MLRKNVKVSFGTASILHLLFGVRCTLSLHFSTVFHLAGAYIQCLWHEATSGTSTLPLIGMLQLVQHRVTSSINLSMERCTARVRCAA